MLFVDGPPDQSEHETFDWGEAALKALDSWTNVETPVYSYDWSKRAGVQREARGVEDGYLYTRNYKDSTICAYTRLSAK